MDMNEESKNMLYKMIHQEFPIYFEAWILSQEEFYKDFIQDKTELLIKAIYADDEAQRSQSIKQWSRYITNCVNESPGTWMEFQKNSSFWMRNIGRINAIIQIIRDNKYYESWDNSWFDQENFKMIYRTPIYIPDACPFMVSGIYFILLLHKDDLSFRQFLFSEKIRNKKSDKISGSRYNEHKEKKRREKYDRVKTDLERLKKIFRVDIEKNTDSPNYDTVVELCGIYRYCVKESWGFNAIKWNLQLASYLLMTGMPMTEVLDEEQSKILVFKTILWTRTEKKERIEYRSYCNYLNEWSNLLQRIRSNRISKSELFHWESMRPYDKSWQQHNEYWEKIQNKLHAQTQKNLLIISRHSSDNENLFFVILWKMLLMEFYWLKIDDEMYWNRLCYREGDIEGIDEIFNYVPMFVTAITWHEFYETYKTIFDIVFDDIEIKEIQSAWKIARQVMVYMEPGRFGVEISDDLEVRMENSKKMDSNWYKEHMPNAQVYVSTDGEIVSDAIKFEELFSLMYMLIKLKDLDARRWWIPTYGNDKSKPPTVRFMLKNIAHYYTPDLILHIRYLLTDVRLILGCPKDELRNIRIERAFIRSKINLLLFTSKHIGDVRMMLEAVLKVLINDPIIFFNK